MNMDFKIPKPSQHDSRKYLPGIPGELRPWIPGNPPTGMMMPGAAADAAAIGKAGGLMAARMTIRLLQMLDN